ncbi:hypothetical protein RN001_010377 [Aquatica leii]|uniref:Fatty acid-binding protein, muscle n=1 Tax=Aquatica leii TaxID=1421715 RepID=A0AAN7P9H1_9COLE|nr:hypothetical protein RN001_010377 [Aquatica leii]
MIDSFLGKKYKLASSENFDEFMKALGVGFAIRKAGGLAHPVVELHKKDDKYVFTSNSTFKKIEFEFKDGVEFDQETPDGRNVKSVITIDGNVLNEVQKDSKGDTIIKRTFSDSELKMELQFGEIKSVRTYKIHE